MTKQDYIALAIALASTRPHSSQTDMFAVWSSTVGAIAETLSKDNMAFNISKFVKECTR